MLSPPLLHSYPSTKEMRKKYAHSNPEKLTLVPSILSRDSSIYECAQIVIASKVR